MGQSRKTIFALFKLVKILTMVKHSMDILKPSDQRQLFSKRILLGCSPGNWLLIHDGHTHNLPGDLLGKEYRLG